MNRSAVALLSLALLVGCSASEFYDVLPGCRDDSECENNQVCFANGCGDPGKNLVVEVTPSAKEGLFAQDLLVEELRDQQTLEFSGPSALQGQVLVKGGATPSSYTSRVTLRATGESLFLPGVPRVQQNSTLDLRPDGSYSLAVASGSYTVRLSTSDEQLPPLTDKRDVWPGSTVRLDFLLPSPSDVVRLTSRVLRHDGLPVSRDIPLEVQAVDGSLQPVSQRGGVNPDTGVFSLNLLRSDLANANLSLQVTSSYPFLPQVRFALGTEPRSDAFLLADYGAPVTLRGRVVDTQDKPVAGATLSLSGTVEGGGTYRGPQVQSRPDGTFELRTLPSAPLGPERELRLALIPPAGSPAGSTEQKVLVPRGNDLDLGDVRCQPRRQVSGTVLRPETDEPAAGIQVEANLLQELKGVPRPAASRVVAPRGTNDQGRYTLSLDPGVYRFDFISVENLPRFSRIVIVRPSGSEEIQDVSVTLPKGRLITGAVRYTHDPSGRPFMPNAGLRFYRKVSVDNQPSALLLGETTTDAQGAFVTTLPLP